MLGYSGVALLVLAGEASFLRSLSYKADDGLLSRPCSKRCGFLLAASGGLIELLW